MKRFVQFIRRARYAGLSVEEYRQCIPEVQDRCAHALRRIMPLLLALLGALFLASCYPGTGEEYNRPIYFSYMLVLGLQYLSLIVWYNRHRQHIQILSYAFLLMSLSFGIVTATLLGENSSSAPFCVLLVSMPLLVIDRPLRLSNMIVVAELLLLICYCYLSDRQGDPYVVVNSLSSTAISVCSTYFYQKANYGEIRVRLLLERQRDMDVMTTAYSRAAYIRDLEELGKAGCAVGVIYADVNGLKQANDTRGHAAGDRLIGDAYELMRSHFASDADRIYRIGGDEFVILCREEGEKPFARRFETMTRAAEQRRLLSCGSAWVAENGNVNDALSRAEREMYLAKRRYYSANPDRDRRGK